MQIHQALNQSITQNLSCHLWQLLKYLSVKLETQESEITNLKKELAVIHKELELNKIKK